MYTNLSANLENSLTAKLNALEYVVDHIELHDFAVQIARGMKHLEEKQITHRYFFKLNRLVVIHAVAVFIHTRKNSHMHIMALLLQLMATN